VLGCHEGGRNRGVECPQEWSTIRVGGTAVFGQEQTLDSLKPLSPKKQLAFALLVFQRLLPGLTAFCKETGRDDSCFLQASEAAWQALQKRQEGSVYESFKEVCLENTPDTEDSSTVLVSDALNAAAVMINIMEFILQNRIGHLASILTLARESVAMYVDTPDPSPLSPCEGDWLKTGALRRYAGQSFLSWPEKERLIAAHPLMQRELRQEEEDIKFLAGLPERLDDEMIAILRARANSQPPTIPFSPK
jgi:hypothetical protein